MKYNLYDCHLHTNFSGDCQIPMDEMIENAIKKGLCGITITDHLDWDYYEELGAFDLDLNNYSKAINDAQSKYNSNDFQIYYGIEIGMQAHLAKRHLKLLDEYNFDFVLGSVHQVNKIDPYYDKFYEKYGVEGGVRAYFETILENLHLFDKMDSVSHLDYILRYIPKDSNINCLIEYKDVIDEILKWIISNNKSLEVNTGAFRCGLSQPNPSYDIISRYYELGGRDITLGADAHNPKHIGLMFEETVDNLKTIGFDGINIYKSHKPIRIHF